MQIKQDKKVVGIVKKIDENHEYAMAYDGKTFEIKVKCLSSDFKNLDKKQNKRYKNEDNKRLS
jgi:uncharacterized protein YecT (DUF1311 family)